jgi:S-adenosylmethionine:tRNA ribosyltransferase-isomerase
VKLGDFDYTLPQELIAQFPPAERGASRLLHLDGRTGALADRSFRDIVDLVAPGDVVVLNDTRVIKARLAGRKKTGGRVEVMVERILGGGEVLAQIGANHPTRAGSALVLADSVEATVLGREREFFRLRFEGCDDALALLERHGAVPLPMYINRAAGERDAERYQTVYARKPGAVAAPTAGLHLTESLIGQLHGHGVETARVTLHVGAGTFRPITADRVEAHAMHTERFELREDTAAAVARCRARGGRVIAVGTTCVRVLESTVAEGDARTVTARSGATDMFIYPPHRFGVVDGLLTNFHLPRSTLLALVMAFAGVDLTRRAYARAMEARYRFYSFGDAMLIL